MSVVTFSLSLLPGEWRRAAMTIRTLDVLSAGVVLRALAWNVAKVFTEAFGIAMVFPLLQFVESGGAVERLAQEHRFWHYLVQTFGFLGVPLNLATLAVVVFLMIGLRQVANYAGIMEATRIKEIVSRKLSARMFHRVMTSRSSYLEDFGTGAFVTVVNQHCHSAASVVQNLVTLTSVFLTFALYGGALLVAAPIPTVITGVFGLVIALLLRPQTEIAKQVSRKIVRVHQEFGQYLSERYRAWRLVRLTQSQKAEDAFVDRWSTNISDLSMENAKAAAKIQLIVTPLAAIFVISGLVIAVEFLVSSLAEITLFVVVVSRLMPMLESYLRSRQALANLSAALYRIKEVYDETEGAREVDGGDRIFPGLECGIVFQGVSFSYPGGRGMALSGVTAEIPAGKITAITGASGAGKSTLVDMVPRIINPEAGKVLVDGTDAAAFTLESLRGKIAYVPQMPLLFGGSIIENVRYALPDASDADVVEACRMAHAHEFIERLPDGYKTDLGEAGARLSGGQRQRLALARAFLSHASILILDEPTSALDYESERHIRDALKEIHQQKQVTIIIIAHRLSTIQDADHLIVLEHGRVVEQGAPRQLGRDESWYAAMIERAAEA